MAGDQTDRSHRFYFLADQLANSPSRKCGMDADTELMYRQRAATHIQEMGQRLHVSQLCINTAIVYMHRFYAFHSFTHFHRNSIAAAALFLAAKVEEQPRKLEHVIKVAAMCLNQEPPDPSKEGYAEQAADLVFNENVLLQTLGFDVAIDHPHTHVVKTCHLVKASKELAQTSYFMASNSLHLTTMCLQYKPTVVACFCIHLACKWSRWEIPQSTEGKHWFEYVDRSVTMDLLNQLTEEFLLVFDRCPSRLKSKMKSTPNVTHTGGDDGRKNLFPNQPTQIKDDVPDGSGSGHHKHHHHSSSSSSSASSSSSHHHSSSAAAAASGHHNHHSSTKVPSLDHSKSNSQPPMLAGSSSSSRHMPPPSSSSRPPPSSASGSSAAAKSDRPPHYNAGSSSKMPPPTHPAPHHGMRAPSGQPKPPLPHGVDHHYKQRPPHGAPGQVKQPPHSSRPEKAMPLKIHPATIGVQPQPQAPPNKSKQQQPPPGYPMKPHQRHMQPPPAPQPSSATLPPPAAVPSSQFKLLDDAAEPQLSTSPTKPSSKPSSIFSPDYKEPAAASAILPPVLQRPTHPPSLNKNNNAAGFKPEAKKSAPHHPPPTYQQHKEKYGELKQPGHDRKLPPPPQAMVMPSLDVSSGADVKPDLKPDLKRPMPDPTEEMREPKMRRMDEPPPSLVHGLPDLMTVVKQEAKAPPPPVTPPAALIEPKQERVTPEMRNARVVLPKIDRDEQFSRMTKMEPPSTPNKSAPVLNGGFETNPDLVSSLLKESFGDSKYIGSNLLPIGDTPGPLLADPPEMPSKPVLSQPPAVVNATAAANAETESRHKSEKKKKKDKHKHKEKDRDRDRKKHKKDKDRHRDRERHEHNSSSTTTTTTTTGSAAETNAPTGGESLKITIPTSKLNILPGDETAPPVTGGGGIGGLKIKIPKERLSTISPPGVATTVAPQSTGLKIKIPRDVLGYHRP